MTKFVPQLTVGAAICLVFLVGFAALLFPRQVQPLAVRWGGYYLWGRSSSLLHWIQSEKYIVYLRVMGAYFVVIGTLSLAAALKGGFFWR